MKKPFLPWIQTLGQLLQRHNCPLDHPALNEERILAAYRCNLPAREALLAIVERYKLETGKADANA